MISVIAVPGACCAVSRLGAVAQGSLSTIASSAAMRALQPGSGYLVRRTVTAEKFHRASIASYANPRWVLWRLAAESEPSCAPADPACSGQGLVDAVSDTYARLVACRTLGAMYSRPPFLNPVLVGTGRACGTAASTLDTVDQLWYRLTVAPEQTTDGIVPGSSQSGFGDTPLSYFGGQQPSRSVVQHGPSHVGETTSRAVYFELQRVLDAQFTVGVAR